MAKATLIRSCAVLALAACSPYRGPENTDSWYDPGAEAWVNEPVLFTDEPYASSDAPISGLDAVFPVDDYITAYADGDDYPAGSSCESEVSNDLPIEIEGVVTIHPRYYIKTSGCNGDEKYYGSFFIEDDTGGVFVLGDSKVAHFTTGNRVRMSVRAAKTSFDLNMVYAWDTLSIDHTVEAVHYENAVGSFDNDSISRVQRVTGEVTTEKDTFGQFAIESDDGEEYLIQLDVELNRRGYDYPIGERIQVTGPVMYSYSEYAIVVMSTGQISVLEP